MSVNDPGSQSGDRVRPALEPRGAAPTPDTEAILSPQLRAALRNEFTPGAVDRKRIAASLSAALTAGALPASVLHVDAAMSVRTAGALRTGAVGYPLAAKLAVSSLLLAGAAVLTLNVWPQTAAPRTSQPSAHAAHRTATQAAKAPEPHPATVVALPTQDHAAARPQPAGQATKPVAPESVQRRRSSNAQPTAAASAAAAAAALANAARPTTTPAAQTSELVQPAERRPTLAAELALVREASTTLERKQPAAALAILAQYAARYPNGALRVESQALRAMALCESHAPAGPAAAASFARDHAGSALAQRVRRACTPAQ